MKTRKQHLAEASRILQMSPAFAKVLGKDRADALRTLEILTTNTKLTETK